MDLIKAIKNAKVGEIDEIKKLIENRSHVNYIDSYSRTPLIMACRKGRLDIVKILYKAGAKHQDNEHGFSAIEDASFYGYVNIVKYLIKKYVIDEKHIKYSITCAVRKNNIDVLDYLLTLGYNLNFSSGNPLSVACILEDIDAIDRLLNAGANVNVIYRDEPLIYCMVNFNGLDKKLDIIKRLVMFGGDINASYISRTPIIIACMDNDTEVAEFLIEMGCDVNCPNEILQTPLMYACKNNNLEIVKLLIKYKADIDFLDNEGKKAIDFVNDANDEIKMYLTKN